MFFNAVMFLLTVVMSIILGYWTQDRDPPVVQLRAYAQAEPVPPGGTLRIELEVNRIRNCHVHIEHVIFDGRGGRIPLPDDDFLIDPGPLGKDIYEIVLQLPRTVAEGQGRYRANRAYFCNPVQTFFNWPIIVPSPSQPVQDILFEISGKPLATPVEVQPK